MARAGECRNLGELMQQRAASPDVRFWPIAAIGCTGQRGGVLMSAFDPKRTFGSRPCTFPAWPKSKP